MTMPWALMAGFFLFVMGSVVIAGWFFLRFRTVTAAPGPSAMPESHSREVVADALIVIGRLMSPRASRADDTRKLLFRAGYRSPSAPAVLRGVQVVTVLVLAISTGWLVALLKVESAAWLVTLLCAAGFGLMLPSRVLEYLVKARARRLRSAIPPALDLLVLGIEAGRSLDQALQDTAEALGSIYSDLSSELQFCWLETRAGTSRAEAFRRLGERSGEEEIKKLAAVLIDAERFGTSLGPALQTHSKFLRTRMRQRAQESARKLSVKLVMPVFFLIFPSVLLVTLGPAYLQLQSFLDVVMK